MVYYKIEDSLEELETREELGDYKGDIVMLITEGEMKDMAESGELDEDDLPKFKNAKCCRSTVHPSSLSACFSVISRDKKMERSNFGIWMEPHKLIIIDNHGVAETCIKKIYKNKFHGGVKIGRFLYDFMESLIETDLRYLEEMGDRLVKIESAVTKGMIKEFNSLMVLFRKEALLFYRYYTQLVDVGEEFQENENGLFSQEDVLRFEKFTQRAEKLREESQVLREYSNQVRDVYHSQVDAKQNKIMKVLTVVTTLFMPLSILTAWYGMNFEFMPELSWRWGYVAFIGGNIILMLLCMWYLKRKKFL